MAEMSKAEIARFVMQGTFAQENSLQLKKMVDLMLFRSGLLWITRKTKSRVGNIIFTTNSTSVKAKNIQYNNRVSICVDHQVPPFSFVTIFGTAKIYSYKQKEVFKWAKKIAKRYVGKGDAEAYGKRNGPEGEVLVPIKPTRIIVEKRYSQLGLMIIIRL